MFNKVVLVGRLTKKPELTPTSTGTEMCRFSIAINRDFSRNDETDFINCVCFKKTASNLVNYMDKGSMILVEGSIRVSKYTTSDGQNRYSTDINANTVKFLERKNAARQTAENSFEIGSDNNSSDGTIDIDEELRKKSVDFSQINTGVPGEEPTEETSSEEDAIIWDL